MSNTDSPTLTATINDVDDNPTVEITVAQDGREIETVTSDVDILLQNNQFVKSFERPVLTLLTLVLRERDDMMEETDTQDPLPAEAE